MSVYGILGGLIKFFKTDGRADVSNLTLSIHRYSAVLLLACSILNTARQFFGDPINCHTDTTSINLKLFETYCFYSSTYSLAADNTTWGAWHSLGLLDSRTVFHNYYQWVCVVLVWQAACCYLPWLLWKNAEGGKVSKLLAKVSEDPLTETSVEDQVANLGDFLLTHRGWFNGPALKLLLCQAACLLNCLVQLYLMDLFLGSRFLRISQSLYNTKVLSESLSVIFPRLVSCSMEVYGPTSSMEKISGLCSLPVNVVNEKIYLVLWFWFIGLTIISMLQLIRQAALLAASLRSCLSPGLSSSITSPRQVRQLVTRGSYGDTVLLQLLAANCDTSQFSALVRHLLREQRMEDSYLSQQLGLSKGGVAVGMPRNGDFFQQDLVAGTAKIV